MTDGKKGWYNKYIKKYLNFDSLLIILLQKFILNLT